MSHPCRSFGIRKCRSFRLFYHNDGGVYLHISCRVVVNEEDRRSARFNKHEFEMNIVSLLDMHTRCALELVLRVKWLYFLFFLQRRIHKALWHVLSNDFFIPVQDDHLNTCTQTCMCFVYTMFAFPLVVSIFIFLLFISGKRNVFMAFVFLSHSFIRLCCVLHRRQMYIGKLQCEIFTVARISWKRNARLILSLNWSLNWLRLTFIKAKQSILWHSTAWKSSGWDLYFSILREFRETDFFDLFHRILVQRKFGKCQSID